MPTHRYRPIRSSDERDRDHERASLTSGGHHRSDTGSSLVLDEPLPNDVNAHIGAKRAEAATRVYGRYSRWVLFVSLGLAAYIYSLDSATTVNYLSFAASAFNAHALISSAQVSQGIVVAVGKPIIAKVADVTSRAYAFLFVLIFYIMGYTVIAAASSFEMVAFGIVIYAVGYTGLQLLTQIVIADMTTLQWRAFVTSIVSLPFIINGFIGPNLAAYVIEHSGWRWGYGMFAFIMPMMLLPLIGTLFWAENKANRLGIVSAYLAHDAGQPLDVIFDSSKLSFWEKARRVAEQLDLVGLILLGLSVSLILLPLTLAEGAGHGWGNSSIILMLGIGFALLAVFLIWDMRYASLPVITTAFLRNRTVVFASIIGFFDFLSYFLTYVYLYSFILVVKPWTTLQATYFMQIQAITMTACSIIAGIAIAYARRYKPFLLGGLIIRAIGCALMMHSRGANASNFEIIITQVLQGAGGGVAAITLHVGAQASVSHTDLAMVIAVVLLVMEIGGAVGSAGAGAVWSGTMPKNLERELPQLSQTQRDALFGSITDVLAYPRGSEIREGVIAAYDSTMKVMVLTATLTAIVPIILAFSMPNWYLGDSRSAVGSEQEPYLGVGNLEHENERIPRSRSRSPEEEPLLPSDGGSTRTRPLVQTDGGGPERGHQHSS